MAGLVRDIVTLLALGSLEEGPLHTYELKKRMQSCVGHFYKLSDGTLYPLLRTLEERGWVESRVQAGEGHPDRVVYEATEPGRQAFRDIASSPLPAAAGAIHFYARLVFFGYLERPVRERLIDERREQVLAEESMIADHMERLLGMPQHLSLLDLRQRQLATELAWLDGLDTDDAPKGARETRRNS